jgi:hypothetical protein
MAAIFAVAVAERYHPRPRFAITATCLALASLTCMTSQFVKALV